MNYLVNVDSTGIFWSEPDSWPGVETLLILPVEPFKLFGEP
jgi:hypothetical protein